MKDYTREFLVAYSSRLSGIQRCRNQEYVVYILDSHGHSFNETVKILTDVFVYTDVHRNHIIPASEFVVRKQFVGKIVEDEYSMQVIPRSLTPGTYIFKKQVSMMSKRKKLKVSRRMWAKIR